MRRPKSEHTSSWWRMGVGLWLLLALVPCDARSTLYTDPEYVIDTWESEDGLPTAFVTAMVQDSEGYLWLGTTKGLVRWDGMQFVVLDATNTTALPSDDIITLVPDRSGALWVGTTRGVAVREKSGKWRQAPLPGTGIGRTSQMLCSLTVRPDGAALATTFDGGVHLSRSGPFVSLPPPPGEPGRFCFGGIDEEGDWWVAQHRFIGQWNGAHWVRTLGLRPEVVEGAVGCGTGRDGTLWVLTGSELCQIRLGAEVSRTPLPGFNGRCTSVREDSRGQVWISTWDSGLWRVRPGGGTVRQWKKGGGLTSNNAYFSFEDREHNLWVGTAVGGLMRFRERTFHSFLEATDRTAPSHFAVAPHPDGGVLIARFGKPLMRVHDGSTTPFQLPPPASGSNNHIRSLLVDRSRQLWLGTENAGVWIVNGETAQHIPSSVAGGPTVRTLFEDSRKRIWMAGEVSLAVFENGTTRGIGEKQGVPSGMVHAFAEDTLGSVWMAHDQGVFRREGERFSEVRDEAGRSLKLASILGDAEGGVWMATANDGLRFWKEGRLLKRPLPPEMPMRGLWSVTDDGLGFLWMSTTRGLLRARLSELRAWMTGGQAPPEWQLFGIEDGLLNSGPGGPQQSAAVRDTKGRLWFPRRLGVAMADPAALHLNTLPPPVPIHSVSHYGASPAGYGGGDAGAASSDIRTVIQPPFPDLIRFPPGSRRLEISYAALSYAAPETVRYQVSLSSGGDTAWQDAAGRRTAHYYDLPAGEYTFRVRASNNHGVWNETGSALAFTIQPFYWQTPWFRTGTLLLTLGGFAGTSAWIVRARTRRMKEVMELNEQRHAVTHLSRVSTLGEISGSLAHELNQPLGAILANAEAAELHLQKENPNLDEVRSILADIRRDDMRAGDIIHGMRAFLQRRELEMRPMDVELLVTETLKLIANDAATRIVTVSVHIEPGLPLVTGDHVHLQQVLVNLLVNGMEAMNQTPPAGRCLAIHATRTDQCTVELAITDAGTGIPGGSATDSFKPFYTSKRGGLGLGLPICRSIIEAHGGSISLTNNPERGATARFTLPVAE